METFSELEGDLLSDQTKNGFHHVHVNIFLNKFKNISMCFDNF